MGLACIIESEQYKYLCYQNPLIPIPFPGPGSVQCEYAITFDNLGCISMKEYPLSSTFITCDLSMLNTRAVGAI